MCESWVLFNTSSILACLAGFGWSRKPVATSYSSLLPENKGSGWSRSLLLEKSSSILASLAGFGWSRKTVATSYSSILPEITGSGWSRRLLPGKSSSIRPEITGSGWSRSLWIKFDIDWLRKSLTCPERSHNISNGKRFPRANKSKRIIVSNQEQ